MTQLAESPSTITRIETGRISPDPFSLSIYGATEFELHDLIDGIRTHGILVPLVVTRQGESYRLLSGHRRLGCAHRIGMAEVPCEIREVEGEETRQLAVLEYNRQRRKTFSQMMREAEALESLTVRSATNRSLANLRQGSTSPDSPDRRNSDDRAGRTDSAVARSIGIGGKDLYRQARTLWKKALDGDPRAQSGITQIEAGTKTIHAAYKDLRRRDRFTAGFHPTPYDVWAFKHDRAFGIPHPGSIPPGIVAHTLHYFTEPGAMVVDPLAGGGTTLDVCESMGRRCLAYDLEPVRTEVHVHDASRPFPPATQGCDLVFCDPPYHTMLARQYSQAAISDAPLTSWIAFLDALAGNSFAALRPGGRIALLLANQTEKDLPAGHGYLDHGFLGYNALARAGFLPERRISCPMDGSYLPQHVRRARLDGRMLGQVRDLLIGLKPL